MYEGLYDTRQGLSEEDAERVGLMTARLMFPWGRWVHRRVERVHFCDEDAVHRDVSIDFTLPYWFHLIRGTKPDEAKRQLVPLGFLSKGTLINFSLRDEHDSSRPLLTKSQNAQVATAVLIAIAKSALKVSVPDEIRCDIRNLVSQHQGEAQNTLKELFNNPDKASVARQALRKHHLFRESAIQFSQSFLALSMLHISHHERRVVHFSYETRFVGNKRGGLARQINRARKLAIGAPRKVSINVPSASEAASYHLEVEAPDGHMINRLNDYRRTNLKGYPVPGSFRRAHFHISHAPSRRTVVATLSLLPRRSTVVRTATLACLISLAATVVVAIRYPEIQGGEGGNEVATALLLAVIGFVGLALGRSGEDEMATELLFPLRVLAVVPVLLAITAALVVVYKPSSTTGQYVLIALSSLIFISALLLGRNWYAVWRASQPSSR